MAKLALFIHTRAKPGRREELQALWEKHLQARIESNPVQEVYFFCLDTHDPDAFHLFELCADPAQLEANASAPWFADYMREVEPLLAEPPTVSVTSPAWAKGATI